jgi:formylglycine-generating enzyme required for sulfatase activity
VPPKSKSSVRTDRATVEDRLGFSPYRDALVEVIRLAETPLTIGVFGAWGSGKTSLLLMLQDALKKAEDEPRARTVWFNAWQYGQEDALWRALLARVLESLRPGDTGKSETLDKETKETFQTLNAKLDDLQASLYHEVDREEVGKFEVDWAQLAKGGLKGAVKLGLSYIPGSKLVEELANAANKKGENWTSEVLAAFQREKTRVHVNHVQFLEQFRDRFERIISEQDRCLPEKAIEVLEAIKLFLDVEECVFVIAVDRRVIEEGIKVKYQDFAFQDGGAFMPIEGRDYLEKIVQLPFNLPPVSQENMVAFIRQEAADLPSGYADDCAEVFARGVETNPRKVKRTLNVFWMHSRLAEHRVELKEVIKPVRLAKVVVIQNRYPDLYRDWVEAPLLLRHLEERFIEIQRWEQAESGDHGEPPMMDVEQPDGGFVAQEITEPPLPLELTSELVLKWADRRPLRRMLLFRAGEEDMGFEGMELEELQTYIYLTSTASESKVGEGAVVEERVWDSLLSNDLTRIQSAVGQILDDEHPSVVRRLRDAFNDREQPIERRISANKALDMMGALNHSDYDVLVEVPAGEFVMGSKDDSDARDDEKPQHPVNLTAYRIGKYPVTNLQYQRFLLDNIDHAAPTDWSGGPGDYPLGKGAHPVTNVSWHDALAYCSWLTGRWREDKVIEKDYVVRLPTEAEWEKAARGTDGRVFPWGEEWEPGRMNSAESELKITTPVDLFSPEGDSPYGASDMIGNVWEWCSDWYDGEDYKKRGDAVMKDPRGPEEGEERVLRGGSFDYNRMTVRCAVRYGYLPVIGDYYNGFRVVVSPLNAES